MDKPVTDEMLAVATTSAPAQPALDVEALVAEAHKHAQLRTSYTRELFERLATAITTLAARVREVEREYDKLTGEPFSLRVHAALREQLAQAKEERDGWRKKSDYEERHRVEWMKEGESAIAERDAALARAEKLEVELEAERDKSLERLNQLRDKNYELGTWADRAHAAEAELAKTK